MKSSIKMSILPLLICLSLNVKTLADSSTELVPLPCNKVNYQDYIWSFEKTQKLIEETEKGCNLTGAKLTGAILTYWLWQNADLKSAIYDDKTIFPEGFDPAAVEFGMKKATEDDYGNN